MEAIALSESHHRFIIAGPVGDEEYHRALKHQLTDLSLEHKALFVGPIFGIAKAALLLESDLHILPSRNENFGNVVLEAAALGTPSIITDRCGVAEVAYPCSEIVQCDAQSLSRAISELSHNTAGLDKLREATSSVTEQNSWESAASIQIDIYQTCLEPSEPKA